MTLFLDGGLGTGFPFTLLKNQGFKSPNHQSKQQGEPRVILGLPSAGGPLRLFRACVCVWHMCLFCAGTPEDFTRSPTTELIGAGSCICKRRCKSPYPLAQKETPPPLPKEQKTRPLPNATKKAWCRAPLKARPNSASSKIPRIARRSFRSWAMPGFRGQGKQSNPRTTQNRNQNIDSNSRANNTPQMTTQCPLRSLHKIRPYLKQNKRNTQIQAQA